MLGSGLIPDKVRAEVPYLIPFGLLGLWRWGLYVVRIVFWLLYRPVQPKWAHGESSIRSGNRYDGQDVTIIIPTIDTNDEFILAARSWLANTPFEIIVVTTDKTQEKMREFLRETFANRRETTKFRILSVPKANKRVQLMKGISAARTPIVALSDDDAVWSPQLLEWLLAPFDDPKMGGVGSRQEMMPVGEYASFWEVIADFRLTMRMIEASATTFVDGGISCLSGRTALYRREILTEPSFGRSFVNEKWLGKYRLHSGDDKFLTRWIVSHGWKMQFQNHKDATIVTTFKDNALFLKQVLRWTRNTWRSDIKSIFFERYIWARHPYVAFCMLDRFINPLPVFYSIFIIIYNMAVRSSVLYVIVPVFAWVVLSRIVRLLPHLIRKPGHIAHVPLMIAFQYCFPILKIYAFCTLHVTDWGSRAAGADTEDFESGVWRGDLEDGEGSANSTSLNFESDSSEIEYQSKKWSSKRKRRRLATIIFGWFLLILSLFAVGTLVYFTFDSVIGILSSEKRRVPVAERWTSIGYRGVGKLPSPTELTEDGACIITSEELQLPPYNVIPNDSVDDSLGLQAAIDHIGSACDGSFEELALIELPAGTVNIATEIHVDTDFLILKGKGSGEQGTVVEFRPGNETKYDEAVASLFSGNQNENSTGGRLYPGRGAFRVQTRQVHPDYVESYRIAATNRRDFFEGSVNFPWKAGINFRRNAVEGDSVLYLERIDGFDIGSFVWVGATNTNWMYDRMHFPLTDRRCAYMRQQIFVVEALHVESRSILLDKPLEFDVPIDYTADGSAPLDCGDSSATTSKVISLEVVRGVGFEDFTLTQIVEGLDPVDAQYQYENLVPEVAMHGFVFKWATDSFVRNVQMIMVGSHSIVTEQCKNMQFERNVIKGSWNKGRGGNGYFRNSKLWDSIIARNNITGLRHLTLQWSASGNLVQGNTLDCDINLHGGWERYNLIENNDVSIPLAFSGSGSHYPIFWASGREATWSGSTGARNVLFNNRMTKELNQSIGFQLYAPYGNDPSRVFQFGWDRSELAGTEWKTLAIGGGGLEYETWSLNAEVPFYESPHAGVNANCIHTGTSLVGIDFSHTCATYEPGCALANFENECSNAQQCDNLYIGSTACVDNGVGGVCFCGEEACGCTSGVVHNPTLGPVVISVEQPIPTQIPTPAPIVTEMYCGRENYQAECTSTAQCRQKYQGASDCWNGAGGVCLCGGADAVCGCL